MGQIVLTTSPGGAWLEVDETPVPLPPSGVLDVEAGLRHIRVSLAGYTPFETTVQVTTDAPVELDVVLEPTAEEAPLLPDEPPAPAAPVAPVAPAGPARLAPWGWALVGVGAAAVAGGAGAHVLAALKADEARGVPNRPDLRAEFEGLRDDARTAELAAYILYGAGAAVAVTGIVLLVVDPGPTAPPTGVASAAVRAPQITPVLLPDGAGLSVGLSF